MLANEGHVGDLIDTVHLRLGLLQESCGEPGIARQLLSRFVESPATHEPADHGKVGLAG